MAGASLAPTPTLLLILDGWGIAPDGPGNAVSLARTPNLDRLLAEHPTTSLACSGRAVGLPDGFMGNSEVGHMNIGAGRVVYQDMTRIDMAIETGELADNPVLGELFDKALAAGGRVHLMGLVSDGGVHSHQHHIEALLDMAKAKGVPALVHAFLDGRDTPPSSGAGYVGQLVDHMEQLGHGAVVSVTGRFWAMDRDKRWERVKRAHDLLVTGQGERAADPVAAVQAAYARGETDEFVAPTAIAGDDGAPLGIIRDGDAVFFFNFRADRARELTMALFQPDFGQAGGTFERAAFPRLSAMATMTRYEESFGLPNAFAPQTIEHTLGQTVSEMGLRQLRLAETEKYAHVTYFLNCGREEPFPGEDRQMIPSPREVDTYDKKPCMSAPQVAEEFTRRWGSYDLVVCNLANLDMVGHTGIIEAAVQAVETVDACVGDMVAQVLGSGGRVLLTADHGNAEEMLDAHGEPQTAHSLNPVRLCLIEGGPKQRLRQGGRLGDIAPTILTLWGAAVPEAMTGRPLIEE